MAGTTPVSSYRSLNHSSETNTQYLTDIDGNSVVGVRLAAAFNPWGSTTMTVNIGTGHVFNGVTLSEVAAQVSTTIAAPVSNSRIDRIVLDSLTGAASVVTGTAAVSPTAPAIPTGKIPCAQVTVYSSYTTLGNSTITDERDLTGLGGTQSRLLNFSSDTGSTNAFAVAPTPAITAYAQGQLVTLQPTHGQTGSATAAVSGLAALSIKDGDGNDPVSGMMSSNGAALLMNNGSSQFILLNPIIKADTIPISTGVTNNVSSAQRGFAPVGTGQNKTLYDDGTWKWSYLPQNSQSSNYTTVSSDASCQILHPSADTSSRAWVIASNASVAYPNGTAITFVNQNGAGALAISSTADTIRLAGAGTTGTRTLAANGIATALKIATTEWIIAGTGLT